MRMFYENEPLATPDDLAKLWKRCEDERQLPLLATVSDILRVEARRVGKDLDAMVEADPHYRVVTISVIVDIVARALMTSTDQEPMTQIAQSAGGYSASGTLLVPGGGIYVKRSELARLGLRRQQVGGMDFYGVDD